MEVPPKRMKTAEGREGEDGGLGIEEAAGSEEMEANIQAILERIERFTQQVSELLETGKAMFSNLSEQFEERLISIHREHIDKWQDEIKELRLADASNEASRALLHNAHCHLLQNVHDEEQP